VPHGWRLRADSEADAAVEFFHRARIANGMDDMIDATDFFYDHFTDEKAVGVSN
jgi:hypothetical protein